MKPLALFLLLMILLTLLSGCTFRKQNPLNVQCPSCGYIWERTPTQYGTDKEFKKGIQQ